MFHRPKPQRLPPDGGREPRHGPHARQLGKSQHGTPRARFVAKGQPPRALPRGQLHDAYRHERQRRQRPMGLGVFRPRIFRRGQVDRGKPCLGRHEQPHVLPQALAGREERYPQGRLRHHRTGAQRQWSFRQRPRTGFHPRHQPHGLALCDHQGDRRGGNRLQLRRIPAPFRP